MSFRFVKWVPFREVQLGDIVGERVTEAYEITQTRVLGDPVHPRIVLNLKDAGVYTNQPDAIIGLLRRPYPEGKTEVQMMAEARDAADFFAERGMGIVPLREALEAYELGKPEKA